MILQAFVPIHQFVEKYKGIYITMGSQTLKNIAHDLLMKGSALRSIELVHMDRSSNHPNGWGILEDRSHKARVCRKQTPLVQDPGGSLQESSLLVARRATVGHGLGSSVCYKSHAENLNLGGSGYGMPSKGYLTDSPGRPVVGDAEELRLGWLETYPPLFTPPLQAVKPCVHILNGVGNSCRRADKRIHSGVVYIGTHS